jgi:transcription elongation factor Elf1
MKYEVGQYYTCPICGNEKASIVWKGEDGKIIGVKCERSHKNKTNSVILIET